MPKFLQVLLALIPVSLTPALIYALAEGVLNFGGGEKDVIMAFPWLVWSVVFAICSFVLIYRSWNIGRWVVRSAIVATVVLLVVAYVGSFFGVA